MNYYKLILKIQYFNNQTINIRKYINKGVKINYLEYLYKDKFLNHKICINKYHYLLLPFLKSEVFEGNIFHKKK